MNRDETGSGIILDPVQHFDGARRFFDHFRPPERPPDLEDLEQILSHFARLPYENLSKILKLSRDFSSPAKIRLPLEIIEDHLQYHLGGTCFSLTFFLHTILLYRGYHPYPVIADMRNRPRTHCALIVVLQQRRYLVDPGYLLTRPMRIDPDRPRLYRSPAAGVELRFNPDDERYHLYTFNRQEIKWRYSFVDRPVSSAEFLGCWHDSFFQGGMHGLCLTRVEQKGLVYLHNNYLRVTTPGGVSKKRLRRVEDAVEDLFGISPEWVERAKAAIPANMAREREHGLGGFGAAAAGHPGLKDRKKQQDSGGI